ncbi:MAG: tetratricopeptide repeat protein, partial [bacterium]|nr:tetratricopeptide repeat protein [bacterium]
FFLSQIEALEGNIKAAISSVETASVLAPNDPTVFFQLGLLRYNDRNYRGAIEALERAVGLNPAYANAKYFLGLSYEKVGRDAEAIAQFTDLQVTNPDNAEVDLILKNLKAGRAPFADAAPPIDAKPEKRGKLPVTEEVEE